MLRKLVLLSLILSSLMILGFRVCECAADEQPPAFSDHLDIFAAVFPEISQESDGSCADRSCACATAFSGNTLLSPPLLPEHPLYAPSSQPDPLVRCGFIRLARDSIPS